MTSGDVPLFEGFEKPEPEPVEELSAGQRLTLRQYAYVRAGVHPLTKGPLHPEAPKGTDRPHKRSEPFTCGGCVHLGARGGHARDYLKCFLPGPDGKRIPARMTGGPQTDVRRWWPACPDYEPRDR